MGNMIASGVFLLPASLAPFGWNAVGAWVLTIGGALVLALVLARLTAARPQGAGPVDFVRDAFGQVPAFLVGWIYLVSIWTAVVTIAVAAVSYLSAMVPALSAVPFGPALAAVALLWLFTLINLRGVRAAGRVQVVTLLLKIVPLVVVLVLAAMGLAGGTASLPPFDAAQMEGSQLNAAATLTLWALLGFECASVAAARVRNPAVNVPRATMWGTALTGVLYLFVCSAIALLLPQDLASQSPAPFATFVAQFWSAGPAALIGAFAVISCLGALNGWTLMQGELARTMAQDRMLPRWFAGTDRHGTPVRALLVSGGDRQPVRAVQRPAVDAGAVRIPAAAVHLCRAVAVPGFRAGGGAAADRAGLGADRRGLCAVDAVGCRMGGQRAQPGADAVGPAAIRVDPAGTAGRAAPLAIVPPALRHPAR